ncbi:outer membrane protein [Phreatobacter stygius]|uniref:Porin family protein n=1 Tax=Phreatobacter stygius TaxID=1940610 RepID=A0A4D7AUV1_9HYPH|nr:outer membrane protein [Phreatobacter stygius]QCI63385.1 porin family protein [Phreatobacter stygius]
MKRIVLAATASLVLASAAHSADLGVQRVAVPAAIIAQSYDWTGFYIGAHAGYGWGRSSYGFNTNGHYNHLPGDRFSHSTGGFVGGGQLGYNWQSGNFVFGLEGSLTWSDVRRANVISPFFPTSDTFTSSVGWFGTVTPRIGFAASNWLLYAKGGLAFGQVRTRIQDTNDFTAASSTRLGWTVGLGAEYAINQNWSVGLEANYYDFGSLRVNQESSLLVGGGPAGVFSDHNVKTTMWSALARVNYRFSTGGGAVSARY